MTQEQITLRDVRYQNSKEQCPYEIKKKLNTL